MRRLIGKVSFCLNMGKRKVLIKLCWKNVMTGARFQGQKTLRKNDVISARKVIKICKLIIEYFSESQAL